VSTPELLAACRPTFAVLVAVAALAGRSEAADSALVTGEVVLPADLDSFAGRVVEIRLYKIHPLLADAPADLVDLLELPDVAHDRGGETRTPFRLGDRATLESDKTYYLTCFILDGDRRTHIGEPPGGGLCKVLTAGQPREATLVVRAVR